jgi:dTDP-4-amino-4,6-dideoxygalactose transaminase
MPVTAFGRVADLAQWEDFHAATKIPVVIDAAAAFESVIDHRLRVGKLPVILSFHATKTFGTGEGGCVITQSADLAERVGQCLNFGFAGSRNAAVTSLNGKMAEYPAAVGLAELDHWDAKRAAFAQVALAYQEEFRANAVPLPLWTSPDVSSSYVILECESLQHSRAIAAALASQSIETRLWYGSGVSGNDAFASNECVDLHGEQRLQPESLLGLPTAVDLARPQVARIAAAVARAISG